MPFIDLGPNDRLQVTAEPNHKTEPRHKTRYRRSGNVIYDTISGSPVCFFSTERDAQQAMTLMEAVAR